MTTALPAMLNVEDRFRRLVEDLRLIVWEFDPATKRFVYVSPQAEAILGYPLEQWQQPEFWYRHLHPDDREEALGFSRQHVDRAEDHEFEYRMVRADGGVVWVRDLTSVVTRDHRVIALHGVLIDITGRKTAEDALSHSEARYRAVVEDQTELICRFLADGTITFVNDNYCRYFGRSRESLVGDTVFSLMSEANAQRQRDLMASLTPEHPADAVEISSTGPDGTTRWRHWIDRAIFDDKGRVREYQAVGRDVTARKEAEEALRESEARLRAVIVNTPNVAIQGYDIAGRVLFWNKAAEALFGWSEEEAVGKTLDRLMLDGARASKFVETVREVHRTHRPSEPQEWTFTRRDGSAGWCYSTVFEIPGGAAPAFICMDVDITRRKQAEQALERSNQQQRLLLSELDHRVRNNLASLAALLDISAHDSRSTREFAASVRSRVQAMSVVHALLSREHWRAVDLRQLLLTLAPVGLQPAVTLSGPTVSIVPRQATALGMVLQELFANSQKHGALMSLGGTVAVTWSLERSPPGGLDRILRLTWREHGGRTISHPPGRGIGTGLVEGLVRTEMRGEAHLRFPPGGADHELVLCLDGPGTPAAERFMATLSDDDASCRLIGQSQP